MQTTSIRVIARLNGRLHAELLIETKETGERFAYEIKKDHNGTLYCDMDGARHDLTEHETRKMGEAIRDLKKEEEEELTKGRNRKKQPGKKR